MITELGPEEEGAEPANITATVAVPVEQHMGPLSAVDAVGPDAFMADFEFDKWLNDFGAGTAAAGATPGGVQAAANMEYELDDINQPIGANPDTLDFDVPGAAGIYAAYGFDYSGLDPRMASLRQFFWDAKALYAEVEGWKDEVPTSEREMRVIAGNKTHQLAMQVSTLTFLALLRRFIWS